MSRTNKVIEMILKKEDKIEKQKFIDFRVTGIDGHFKISFVEWDNDFVDNEKKS